MEVNMTKIKLCGLSRMCDIEAANELEPEYIGFVFALKSRRYVSPEKALALKKQLNPEIKAVGVFVNEKPEWIADLLRSGVIDIAQLHGRESEESIVRLRQFTDSPVIKAFSVDTKQDIEAANASSADYVLLDSGKGGTGSVFDWRLIEEMNRPYFLAGGLTEDNVRDVVKMWKPYAVDVSSGIESGGYKDRKKMERFVKNVRSVRQYSAQSASEWRKR